MISDVISKYTVQKPKLFLFGGCDLWDSVNVKIIRDSYYIDRYAFSTNKDISLNIDNKFQESTSLLSLYSKPGDIANRVQDTLYSIRKLEYHHILASEQIMKYDYLNFFKRHAGPRDILLLNFTNDLYTKFRKGSECFSLLPQLMPITHPRDPLYWLFDEYLKKDVYHLCFDERESLKQTTDAVRNFADDIYHIFQDRVILVKFHLSNLAYRSTTKNIKTIPWSCSSEIPFYKTSRIMIDPTDHSYAKRCANMILDRFQSCYSNQLPIVELDDNECFIDLNHRHGISPLHLHPVTTEKLGYKIYEELIKLTSRIEQNKVS